MAFATRVSPSRPLVPTAAFSLLSRSIAPLVAEISTSTINGGHAVTSRNVFRVKQDQIAAATISPMLPAAVDITPAVHGSGPRCRE